MASKLRRSRITGLLSSLLTSSRTRPVRANRQSRSYHDLTENIVSLETVESLEERALLAYVDPTPEVGIFEEQGGAPVQNGQIMNVTPNRQVTGAIEDVLAHPTNPDILFVGTINGGIWRTDDATSVNPTWVPQTDIQDSLSIGAIEFDVSDPTGQRLVAGTGNYSSFASSGGPRGRIYVTDDGGTTWTDPGGVGVLGQNISGVARRGDEIVVTSQSPGGIFRSTDGGATFTGVADEDFVVGDNFFDLVHDDSTPGRLYAAAEERGVYRSDDFGVTWDKITGATIHPGMNDLITDRLNNNMEMTVHPVTGRLYLAVINASQPVGIFYTSDGEADNPIWTEMDVPILPVAPGTPITGAEDDPAAPANGAGPPIVITAVGHGLETGDLALVFDVEGNVEANGQWTVTVLDDDNVELQGSASGPDAYVANTGEIVRITNPSPSFKDIDENGSQGRIHFSITTDPTDDNLVYIGGDRQEQPNLIGDTLFGGSIFRGDVTIDRDPLVVPSPQWDHVTNNPTLFDPQGGTLNNTGTHADSRDMTFRADGLLLEVDDGGIFARTSPQDNQGDWFSLAGNLGVVEYHDIVYDTNSDVILGGTQDNGTHLQTTPDSLTWSMINGGDGGDVVVDNVSLAASGQSIRYLSSQNLGGFQRSVWDADNNRISNTRPALIVTDGGTFRPQFDTPIAINAVEPESLIFGGNTGIFESFDQGESLRKADNVSNISVTGLAGNPIAYGGFSAVNGDNRWVIYAGANDGRVWVRTEAAGVFTSNTDLGGAVRDVRINPNEWMEAFAIDSNTVSMTQDAGGSWNDITGNLLALGARDFRSLEYISGVEEGIVVGTELGVFAMMFDHVGEWFQYGSALPNAPVWDMDYDIQDDVLVVGTLGRGAWKMNDASTFLTPKVILETDVFTIPEDESKSATITARLSRTTPDPVTVDFVLDGTATFTTDGTFASADTPLALADASITADGVTSSTIAIADSGPVHELTVTLDISHADTSDLDIVLIAPDGTRVDLVTGVSGSGFTGTTFDDAAATSITAGVSPFTGSFSPEGQLADFDGVEISGNWTLEITDTLLGTAGQLNSWSIAASYKLAAYPSDYTASAVSIVIPPGGFSDTITLTAIQDLRDEDDETIEIDADITNADRFLLPANPVFVDTYASAASVAVPDGTTVTSTISIPDAGLINDLNVALDITHDFVQDLDVTLISPAGTRVQLVSAVGFDGDNFTDTTLDDEAALSITAGTAPFTGSFIPQEALSQFDGENLSGIWTLEITDAASADSGTLNGWSITADVTPQAQTDPLVLTIIDDDVSPLVTLWTNRVIIAEDGVDTAVITARLDALAGRDVIVDLVFSGTAELSDYTLPSQIVIPEGSLFATINLTATVDDVDEIDETVIVDIASITNGIESGVQQTTTTILDNDLPPEITLSVDEAVILESPAGPSTATFTATLDAPSEIDITVTLDVTPFLTAEEADFTTNPAPLALAPTQRQFTILAGDTTGTMTLTAVNDAVNEPAEDIDVAIVAADFANFSGAVPVGVRIIDDDALPFVSLAVLDGGALVPAKTIDEDPLSANRSATIRASLDVASQQDVTVVVDITSLLTAQESDFSTDVPGTPTQRTITIPAGDTFADIELTAVDDVLDEEAEDLQIDILAGQLVNGQLATPQQVVVTINDDDLPPLVELTVDRSSILEDSGLTARITATLVGQTEKDVTVFLDITGTAEPADFNLPTQIFIAAGSSSAFIDLSVNADAVDEFDETVVVDIDTVTNGTESGTQQIVTTIIDDDLPPEITLAVDSGLLFEGVVGFDTATFTATLDAVSEKDVTVTLDVTSFAPAEEADFITNPAPLILEPTRRQFTIPAGSTTGTMTLTAIDDLVDEPFEIVEVDIVAADFADFTRASVVAIGIADNDPAPVVSLDIVDGAGLVSAKTIDEDPLSTDRSATIRASLDVASQQDVTVVVDITSLLTAQESDFSTDVAGTPTRRTIVIPAGDTFADIELTAVDDGIDEEAEDLQIDIVAAALLNGQLAGPEQVVVTIADDDAPPLVQLGVDANIAEDSGGTAVVTATLVGQTEKDVTVLVNVTGTAISGDDYTASQIPIVIPAGSTSGSALFAIQDDNIYEDNETIIVDIDSVTNGTEDGVQQQTITIVENEPRPTVSLAIGSTVISENGGSVLVTASLDARSALPVEVTFGYGGVAIPGTDYVTPPGTITIPAGSDDASIIVQAIPDTIDEEDNESVIVSIASSTNSDVGVGSVTASIVDDDLPALVSLLPPAAGVSESNATGTFTLELNTPSGRDIVVDLGIVGTSTATGGGVDYIDPVLTGILIPRGTTSVDVDFTTVSDVFDEFDETLTLEILSVTDGAPNNQSEATATILDDDDAPEVTLSVSADSINEEMGVSTITVEIDAVSAIPVTVDLSLTGTASSSGGTPDYNPPPLQLVIAPGDLEATAVTTTIQDLFSEPDETIIIDVVGVTNGQEATEQQQTITIIDDDDASLSLSISRSEFNEIDGVAAAVGTVTRNTDLSVSLLVDIVSSDTGEATSPIQVFIPVGATSASFLIAAVNDMVLDGTQTVSFTASALNHLSGVETVDVLDSTFSVDLNVSSLTATEAGETVITIEAVSGAPVIGNQTVGLQVSGTGITSDDYTLVSSVLTIPDGQTSASTTLTINDDDLVELLTENLTVALVSPSIGLELGTVSSADIAIQDNDSATISIDDVTVLEGDVGSAAFVFTLTLSDEVDTDVLFEISTADGSATVADNDYVPVSGASLGFVAGQGAGPLVRTIAIQAVGDNKVELDESFTVELSNLVASGRNVTFAKASGSASITNEDAATISIADVSMNEGDSGSTVFSLEVTLDSEVDSDVTIDFATLADTASDLTDDYTAVTGGLLTFVGNSGGAQVQTIDIQVSGDQQVESDEAFTVDLTNLVASGRNITVSDSQAVASILNDDEASISVDDVEISEGDSGNSTLTFTVTLDGDLASGVTVDYAFASDTATIGEDFVSPADGTLSFAGTAGETMQVSVDVAGDTTVEQDETFFLNLSNLVAGGLNVSISDAQGVGTINNDDAAEISINDVTANETDSGITSLIFEVAMTGEVDTSVVLTFSTSDGTALLADGDYVDSSGFVRFDPNPGAGNQTRTFAVQVLGDQKVELDEAFAVELSDLAASGRNVTIVKSQGTATITNEDSAAIGISDASVVEGDSGTTNLSFIVTLDAEVDDEVSVDFSSASGSATLADSDYAADDSGTITFAADSGGAQTATVSLVVNGDVTAEVNETVLVDLANLLTNGLNVSISDAQAVGTIQNDDSVSVSVSDATVVEGDSGSSTATFTITLDGDNSADVVLGLSTGTATAVANEDFVPVFNDTVTFTPGTGVRSQTFSVEVLGDEKVETDEIFQLNLVDAGSNGLTVILTDDQALATVTNDDSAQISISDVSMDEGSNGNTQFVFTVTLDSEVDVPLGLEYSTADQTATIADNDYVAGAGSLLFEANKGPGPQTQTLAVRATGDSKVELDETFLVELSNLAAAGRNVTVSGASGQASLINDDTATVSVSDVSAAEGTQGTSELIFTVVLDGEVDAAVQVDSTTMADSALAGDDFQPGGTQSFSFVANGGVRQVATFGIQIVGDDTVELDESFFVNLGGLVNNGRNVIIGNGQASGIIENDDTANLSIADVQISETNSGSRNITFTASLDADIDVPFGVDYATADGIATVADGDYNQASGTLNFTGAATETRTFAVQINGDTKVELNEGFAVGLLNLNASGRDINLTTAQATVIIENDDAASISIADVGMVEGQTGTTQFDFVVTLNEDVDAPVELQFETRDGSATTSSGDYVSSSGTLNFTGTAGETRTISVLVNGDGIVEEEETFSVVLSNLTANGRNVDFLDDRATGTIGNEDSVLVSISDASVSEGHFPDSSFLTFTVTRSNTSIPVDIDFVSIDGTATVAGGDYVPVNGTLNFPAGSPSTANVVIEVLGDHVVEANETVFVELSSTTSGVVMTDNRAVGTILQDDGSISGQKWLDANGNGVRESTEPGLDGWIIQVTDSAGRVVSEATTGSIDLNNDGSIDPITEQGLYTVPTGNGDWFVQEVLPQGWKQTSPGDGDALAFQLDQQLGLITTGSLFENWGGLGEKWIFGSGNWYFITPAGNLFQWDGSPRSNITGDFVATLGSRFFDTPSLLTNAQESGQVAVTVSTNQAVTGIDFGNTPTGSIEGRKWHDADGDGRRDSTEPWLNGWTIDVTDANGNIIATTTTANLDRNNDGQIDPVTEVGWYRFDRLVPGDYTVTEQSQPLWTQAGSDGLLTGEAFRLNEERRFITPQTDFLNWGGRQEKWLWGRGIGWHFVTPDGSVFEWNGSPRTALTGTLVSQLSSAFHEDLSLIYNPAQPSIHEVTITGQEVTGVNFGNSFGHNGTGSGDVTVSVSGSSFSLVGDSGDNTVVVYKDVNGNTLVTGVGGTTLNGLDSPVVVLGDSPSVSANLGGGNDQFVAYGISASNGLTVNTGAGLDRVALGSLTAGSINVTNDSGNDLLRLLQVDTGNLGIQGGSRVAIEESNVSGGLNVESSLTSMLVIQDTTVSGTSNVQTGVGADAVIANRSMFGAFSVNSGAGNDVVALYANTVQGALDVSTFNGNDTIGARSSNSFNGGATIRGGRDTDTFASDGTSTAAVLENIESNDNGVLDDLIDDVLGNFDDLLLNI